MTAVPLNSGHVYIRKVCIADVKCQYNYNKGAETGTCGSAVTFRHLAGIAIYRLENGNLPTASAR